MGPARWLNVFRFIGLGWYVVVSLLLGLLGGLWLDQRLGTIPLFTLLGVVLGMAVAIYGTYKMLLPFIRQRGE